MPDPTDTIATLPPSASPSGASTVTTARRPVWVPVATGAFYTAAALTTAGLLWAFWNSVDMERFPTAAWLNGVVETEPGSLVRVAMVTGLFVIMLVANSATLIAGFHAWAGYRWSRWAGVVAVVASLPTLMINPLAAASLAPAALGALLLWLPSVRAWLDDRHRQRHPDPVPVAPAEDVHYGPLPRYR